MKIIKTAIPWNRHRGEQRQILDFDLHFDFFPYSILRQNDDSWEFFKGNTAEFF